MTLQEQVHKKAMELLGSADAMPEEIYTVDGFAELLDAEVRLCDECGWWVEADDVDEANICSDCRA